MDDGIVREEYTKDAPFVGRRCNRPTPSFHVGCDVFARCFIAVCSTDGNMRAFWVARVVTNLSQNPGHRNQIEIEIQYQMPSSFQHLDANTYVGWDAKEGNVWCEDKGFLLS